MITLRDYQVDMVQRTSQALRKNRRVILQAPTGSGKTAVASHMMATARDKGMSSFFLVHQNELLRQTSRSLWHYKIEHGLIASGRAGSPLPIQLASVMTLKNRTNRYAAPDLIIVDESHRALAATYQHLITEVYPDAYVVGLTATPRRTDGKPLDHIFEGIVHGPSIRYLTERGYLCDYDLFGTPAQADMSKVRTKAGDYDAADTERAVNKPTITGDAVAHYKRLAYGRPTVVMCATVKHAEDVAQAYCDAGIPARAIHGQSQGRDDILDAFERGEFMVLTSVQLMIEGVDLPFLSCVQWLRPTQSIVVWMQGNGRGLRPHDSKDGLLILDHVGNHARHGLPDDRRKWTLEGRKKRGQRDEPRLSTQTCEQCYFTFRSGVHQCPHCGHPVEFQERKLIVVDGELERIRRAAAEEQRKRDARAEQGAARSIDDLVALGIRRGMRKPAHWAANVFASRQQRRPTTAETKQAMRTERVLRDAVPTPSIGGVA